MKRSNLTIVDLAKLCDVTPQEVIRAFAAGTVKGQITDGPTVRITREAAMKFLLENKNAAIAVYTTGQVAKLCNMSQQTIIRCFDSGIIKGYTVPMSKHRRIPLEALAEFMVEHNIPYGGKSV